MQIAIVQRLLRHQREAGAMVDAAQQVGKIPADMRAQSRLRQHRRRDLRIAPDRSENRSEEHTSELQSLMRISYAVFCLKKKKKKQYQQRQKQNHLTTTRTS